MSLLHVPVILSDMIWCLLLFFGYVYRNTSIRTISVIFVRIKTMGILKILERNLATKIYRNIQLCQKEIGFY